MLKTNLKIDYKRWPKWMITLVTFWILFNGHADSLGVKKQVGQKWPFPVVKGLMSHFSRGSLHNHFKICLGVLHGNQVFGSCFISLWSFYLVFFSKSKSIDLFVTLKFYDSCNKILKAWCLWDTRLTLTIYFTTSKIFIYFIPASCTSIDKIGIISEKKSDFLFL